MDDDSRLGRANELYQRLGDVRGESEAAFWVGCFHQVVRGDSDLALPFFERSYQLASQVGDKLTLSYAARHLGFVYAEAGTLHAVQKVQVILDIATTPFIRRAPVRASPVAARDPPLSGSRERMNCCQRPRSALALRDADGLTPAIMCRSARGNLPICT